MAGEPTAAQLTEARLVAMSCEKASAESIEVRVQRVNHFGVDLADLSLNP